MHGKDTSWTGDCTRHLSVVKQELETRDFDRALSSMWPVKANSKGQGDSCGVPLAAGGFLLIEEVLEVKGLSLK